MTGGGSGGHITPLLAVAAELKRLRPEARIIYIGQRGDGLGDIPAKDPNIDAVHTVRAGKFRRYHGRGVMQIFDIVTMAKNLRDALLVLAGLWQSFWLLGKLKPEVIFVKGGFVGVPVGLAAAARHLPYITHDSDAIPGLANRIIARWATLHAVALPKEAYKYPADKTVQVGVPVHGNYSFVKLDDQTRYRQEIGLSKFQKLLLITGGGLGAQRVNAAVIEILPQLLEMFSDLAVVHVAGRNNEVAVREKYTKILPGEEQGRVEVRGYLEDLYRYSAAADVVVARAGATNLAELALQGKACVIVPNPLLTSGHQLKNASYLADQGAVKIVTEDEIKANSTNLGNAISSLLGSADERTRLGKTFTTFAIPDAASKLAVLLLEETKKPKNTK